MARAETRVGISPPAPIGELLQNREKIQCFEILTTHERANGGQLLFMVSYDRKVAGGRYETTLGANTHQLGELPEIAHELFPRGRAFCYLSVHTPENTNFMFGKTRISPEKSFLALNWVSPVDLKKGCKQAERFVVRMDGFTYNQAEGVIKNLLSSIETKDEGNGIVSFNAEFDPLDQNNYLSKAIGETIGLDNLLPQQQKLISQIENQTKARLLTHNPEQNSFEVKPIFLNGKYYVHDMVLDKYVLWEEVTSDQKSLSFIHDAERMTAQYLKDPSRFKRPLVISFGVMLSARTAGFRDVPSSAVSQLTVNQFGEAVQNTEIVPTQNVDPRLFDRAVSSWSPDLAPAVPFYFQPKFISTGVGMTIAPLVRNPEQIPAQEVSAYALSLIAPAIVESAALFAAPLLTTTVAPVVLSELMVGSMSDSGTFGGGDLAQVNVPIEYTAGLDEGNIYSEEPADFNDFSDPPIEPLPEPIGGGGLMLSEKIEAVVWDQQMEKIFRQTQKPRVFVDTVVPQEIEHEQVVFEDLSVTNKEEQKRKKEITFHQLAAELEVMRIENTDESTFLLTVIKNQSTILEDEIKTEGVETENIFEVPVLQETTSYDAAPYYSADNVKDEIPEQVNSVESVIEKQQQDTHSSKFFISPGLLTNYLLWRKMFKDGQISGVNIGGQSTENSQENTKTEKTVENGQERSGNSNTSFATKIEQHKTQAKKVKIRTNPAFLSLLLLTKIKLLTKVKLLTQKNNLAGFKQLFATDTLLLFLLNPKLFLVNKNAVAD